VRQTSPILVREELGRRLRAAREAAKLNLRQAAADLDLSASSLSRIEKGQQPPTVHLVRSMMDLYNFFADDLIDKVRLARKPGWWRSYGISDKDFVALETGASRESTFEIQFVPGLLQTADYARAVFASEKEPRSDDRMADVLDVRMIRQDRLTDEEHPLTLVAVIDEHALRRPIGGPGVMLAQLRHLTLVAELPTVTLQVLPSSVVTNDSAYGGFTILDFPREDQPSVAHVQHALGEERSSNPEVMHAIRLRFEHLRSLALDPEQSVAFIEQVADELWDG